MSEILSAYKFKNSRTQESLMDLLPLPCLPQIKSNDVQELANRTKGDTTLPANSVVQNSSNKNKELHDDTKVLKSRLRINNKSGDEKSKLNDRGSGAPSTICSDFVGFSSVKLCGSCPSPALKFGRKHFTSRSDTHICKFKNSMVNQTDPTTCDNKMELSPNKTTNNKGMNDVTENVLGDINSSKTQEVSVDINTAEKLPPPKVYTNCSNNNNKCFSESTSEFPLSSARTSRTYRGRCGQRPVILKNTLPTNSFERKLAMLSTSNPQMTFEEKLSIWNCETDLSDVEDVNTFDDIFKSHEEQMKRIIKTNKMEKPDTNSKKNCKKVKIHSENYDFSIFRTNLMKTLDKKNNSRKSSEQRKEASTTSPAIHFRGQRQPKTTVGDNKHNKCLGNCTASTVTSLPENANNYQSSNALGKFTKPNIVNLKKRICLSSSDEASLNAKQYRIYKSTLNMKMPTVFEEKLIVDKSQLPMQTEAVKLADSPSQGLIKFRLDFVNEKKGLLLQEKRSELFKTMPTQSKISLKNMSDLNNTSTQNNLCTSDKVTVVDAQNPLLNGDRSESGQEVGFHQQHEFCNYLGLTGMSTANAVASAVAELAKCNLKRRSLRVHRIQQQEKEKTTKDKTELNGVKDKIACGNAVEKETPDINDNKSIPCSRNSTLNETDNLCKEPEIKIVCQISAASKKDAEKMSTNYVQRITKDIVKPTKENLLRKLIQSKDSLNNTNTDSRHTVRSLWDDGEGQSMAHEKPMLQRFLRKRSQSSKSTRNVYNSIELKEIKSNFTNGVSEQELMSTNLMHEKMKQCLEATRQLKPSISIVSAINNCNDVNTFENKNAKVPSQPHTEFEQTGDQIGINIPDPKPSSSNEFEKISNRSRHEKYRRRYLYNLGTNSFLNISKHHQMRNRNLITIETINRTKQKNKLRYQDIAASSINIAFKTPTAITKRSLKAINKKFQITVQKPKAKATNKKVKRSSKYQKDETNNGPMHGDAPLAKLEKANSSMSLTSKTPLLIPTKDTATQCNQNVAYYLSKPNCKSFQSPLKNVNGRVLFIYYEMDILIAIQEQLVSFWKFSRAVSVLAVSQGAKPFSTDPEGTCPEAIHTPTLSWIFLGECKRLTDDLEIYTPFTKRMCVNNSMPMYVEMRYREVPRGRRECHLLFMYINVYYYHDDELHAKMHSVQLDAVQSAPQNVIYTTIPDSRYFVMAWPQENILNKTRSGLCKYALTPYMDTLASIRDFKSLRHEICQLECTGEDKLIGLGVSQITVWDHRSGDVLMNYDLNIELGHNLGSIYYPSHEVGQNNLLLMFQYVRSNDGSPELMSIGCNISHSTPSHRILHRYKLPFPAFNNITDAINTGDHLIVKAQNDQELWISCTDPCMITSVPAQHTYRCYMRGKTHVVELNQQNQTLTVDSFANHILKLAASGQI